MNSFLRGSTAHSGMLFTHLATPKINTILVALSLLLTSSVYSQTHTSKDNHSGTWFDANTWSTSAPGNSPNASAINIYGYVRIESGGLIINNNSPAFTIYDTLFIVGNFDLGQGNLNIRPGAVLVVVGDLNVQNGLNQLNIQGNLVVKGALNVSNGSVLNPNDHLYVFGSTSASGGGTIDGCNPYGGCTPASQVQNQSQLQSDNPSLYNFVNNGGVLPVQLLYFRGVHDAAVNKLSWATASELNFDYFNLQRSSDGRKFETIGAVKGNGTTKEQHNYSFNDTYLLNGTSYYRLQSVDFDGYTETFSVISLSYEAARNAFIYPIPVVNSNLNIRLNFEPKNEIKVSVLSISGIERIKGIIKANEINAYIDLSLEPGVYIVKMSSIDFNKVSRIVVN